MDKIIVSLVFSLMLPLQGLAQESHEEVLKAMEGEASPKSTPTPTSKPTPAPVDDSDVVLKPVVGPPLPILLNFLKAPGAEKKVTPMNFNIQKSGGKLLPQKFLYLIDKKAVRVGPVAYHEQVISVSVKARGDERDIIFSWPDNLPKRGKIELIDLSNNKVVWEETFSERNIGDEIKKVEKKSKKRKKSFVFYQWFEKDVGSDIRELLKKPTGLKACYRFKGNGYKHAFCTGAKKLVVKGGVPKLVDVKNNLPVSVSINGSPAKLKGIIVIGRDADEIKFKVVLSKGTLVEFETRPSQFEIIDAVGLPENKTLLRATGATPYSEGVRFLDDDSWEAEIKNAKMYVGGTGEIPFYQEIFISQRLPKEKEKLKIHNRSFVNTYAPDTIIYGYLPPTEGLKSLDGVIKKHEDKYYVWKIDKLKKGQINKRESTVEVGDKNYTAILDVYRGYQIELSARLSGVALVETQELLFIGDLIFGSWYETLFGNKNYYFGQQRWGLYLKHFTSLTSVDRLQNFTATSADLKYRLVPGVWEKDATVGLIAGYQTVSFNSVTLPMYGVGAFWARSMPQFFDRIFNIIPWFRYPKWVDMEMVNYIQSGDPKYTLGTNFVLNFHGKMLFTRRFFMEGGGSLRQIEFQNTQLALPPTSGALLTGTLGFGYNF